jgi:hypothetical protein
MADVTPDWHVEQQRLVVDISSLKTNLARSELEIMELDSRRSRSVTNHEATLVAIKEAEEKLAALVEVHGKPKAPKL